MKSGFVLINKPVGPTSHDIVDQLRRITGVRKIGHAGTLDPFANGLLIMAIGREATRNISQFVKLDKVYIAKLHLGAVSDTHDRTGNITESRIRNKELRGGIIKKALKQFEGKQKQIPPMYSAKKIGGKKLYELAREGKEIEREPRDINIHYIKLLKYKWPFLEIEVKVSSGTYIRSLGFDIGEKLGVGAYLEELQRTSIDKYKLKDAVEVKNITKKNWEKYLFSHS